MNGFEKYNIGHLSPSSLNLFLGQPAAWVLRYVGKYSDAGDKFAACRGTAVEAGMTALLLGTDLDGAVRSAEVNWGLNVPKAPEGLVTDGSYEDMAREAEEVLERKRAAEAERVLIRPMVKRVAKAVSGWPRPVSTQRRVSAAWRGDAEWPAPVIGYLDYEMPDCVVDLKTTKALPSEPRADHVRQAAVYARATGLPVKLLYVTPKKSATYELTQAQIDEGWRQIVAAAEALEIVLRTFGPKELKQIYVPDFDHYVWNDAMKETWNVFAKG